MTKGKPYVSPKPETYQEQVHVQQFFDDKRVKVDLSKISKYNEALLSTRIIESQPLQLPISNDQHNTGLGYEQDMMVNAEGYGTHLTSTSTLSN
jgi:hypothetical protein